MTTRPAPDVIVGGVPGAGKTTAIRDATRGIPGIVVIDPSQARRVLARLVPLAPYRAYRWLVHSVQLVRVVARLLSPPAVGGRLVIHDPGTRAWRRSLYSLAARLGRRRLLEIYIDPTRAEAEEGQRRRGRVVRSFAWHWAVWERLRPSLAGGTGAEVARLVPREAAADAIRQALRA